MVTLHTLRTSAKERLLAMELALYHSYFAKIGEITDHIGVLVAAVGDGPDDVWAMADVV